MPARFDGLKQTLDKPVNAALAITLAFTVLRLLLCVFIGLGTNEAYAIASGRIMSLSYFDHPPLHFWLAHLGEIIFGDNRAARIPFILLGGGTSWMMFLLTRRLFDDRAGLWATLIFNLSIFFSLVSGNWILPDGPLNFFLLATALALAPLARGETQDPARALRMWIMAGVLLGLAALSKYHAFAFAGGMFLFLFTASERRKSLLTPGPYLGAAIALLVFSPVIIWNVEHDWVSFRFQGDRASFSNHVGIGSFFELLAAQIVLLTPWVAVPILNGTRAALRAPRKSQTLFFLWLGLPMVLFFTFAPLWSDKGMVQWAMPGWLLLIPLAGVSLAGAATRETWPRRWLAASTILFLLCTGVAVAEIETGWLGKSFPATFHKGDPTLENVEWSQLGDRLRHMGIMEQPRTFVVAADWREASKIDQALAGRVPVLVLSDDARNFSLIAAPSAFAGWSGVLVERIASAKANAAKLFPCFTAIRPSGSTILSRGARPEIVLDMTIGLNFLPTKPGCVFRR